MARLSSFLAPVGRVLVLALVATTTTPAAAQEDGENGAEEAEAEAELEADIDIDPEIFDLALEDFYDGRFPEAAAGFWGYINFGEPSAENFEWAQYFLAECLRKLGMWHGAVLYY